MRSVSPQSRLWDGATLKPQLVSSYRHVVAMVTVTGAGTAGAEVLFRATAQQDVPNFAAAATATNFHTTVQSKNLVNGATINGDVGIPVDATGVTFVEINTNLISWLGLDVTTIAGATFTIDIVGAGSEGT